MGGFVFVGYQIREARKGSELTALLTFFKNVTDAEDRMQRSAIENKQQVYFEFLNLLETYAAACNSNLLSGKAEDMVVDKLCSSVAVIQDTEELHGAFTIAVTDSSTFEELVKFIKSHRDDISLRTLEMRNSRIIKTQSEAT